jgi:hypothetical protein
VPILLFFIKLYKTLNIPLKVLFFLSIVSLISDLACTALIQFKINTHIVFHFYNFIEGASFVIFYYHSFKINNLKKSVLIGAVILFIAALVSITEPNFLLQINDIVSTTQGLVVSGFSFLLFYQMLLLLEEPILKHSYVFWINSGILIYSSLPIFVFIFYRIVPKEVHFKHGPWLIFLLSTILFHIFLFIGLCKYKNKETY